MESRAKGPCRMGGDGSGLVVLAGDAGIRAAAEVARQLRDGLARYRRVEVSTDALTGADVTTVQTLLAARRQAGRSGGDVSLRAPVGEVLAAVLRAGGFLAPGQADAGFWPLAAPGQGPDGGPDDGVAAQGSAT